MDRNVLLTMVMPRIGGKSKEVVLPRAARGIELDTRGARWTVRSGKALP